MSHSKRFMGRLQRATHLRGGLAGRSVAAAMILAPAVSLALSGASGALAQTTPSAEGDVSATAEKTFSTTQPITIVDNSSATPYPSRLVVDGITGSIVDVELTLKSFTHPLPDDVDIILEAPEGQSSIVFSDVGGAGAVNTLTLTLADGAGGPPPNDGPLVSGRYRPADYDDAGDNDDFGDPAPAPVGDTMAVFAGGEPEGTWRLYVRDDTSAEGNGSIGSWSLKITTTNTGPTARDDHYQTKQDDTLKVHNPGVIKNDSDPDNDTLTARVINKPRNGSLRFDSKGGFTYKPKSGFTGTDSFVYEIKDAGNETDRAKVTIDVEKSRN